MSAAVATPTSPPSNPASSATQSSAAPVTPAQSTPAATAPAPTPGAGASLYVGELEGTVTEAMLFEIFNMIGPVASIRVCRDAVTRRSLGYAYVNYLSAADGERALEALNYSLIKNKPCRIMWSQRDPALRKTGQGNIFIKNLDESIDNKALHDTFAAFGEVLSCKVALDETGKSRGFAFVHYSTGEAADSAIKNVNGMLLNDKKVFVGHHVGKKERMSKVEEQRAQFTNIFVKNVDESVTDEEFEEMFKKFGDIISAALGKDEEGKSKGFGFVNFHEHESATKAVDELNDTEVKGKKLYVGRAQKRSERDESLRQEHEDRRSENEAKSAGVNLYVKNLDDEWDDDRLRAEFDSFGTITSCKVMRDEQGNSRNFGFVCYSTPEEATKAVSEMNNKMIGSKPLYVALAQRKDVRRQALESAVAQRTAQRMQYAGPGAAMGMPGFYGQPMGYPMGYPAPMPGYGQPGMPMRGPMYPAPGPGGPMGQRPGNPRYPQQGMGGMGMPYGGMPMPGYPGMPPNYGRGPGPMPGQQGLPGMPRPGQPGQRVNGGPSPNGPGLPSGLPQAMPRGQMPVRPQAGGGAAFPGQEQQSRLSAQALARANPNEQKQMLGEALYPLIHETHPELAGKITGMLLEMENTELLHLIESPPALQDKVEEALRVLAEWGKKQDGDEDAAPNGNSEAVDGEVKKEEEDVKKEEK